MNKKLITVILAAFLIGNILAMPVCATETEEETWPMEISTDAAQAQTAEEAEDRCAESRLGVLEAVEAEQPTTPPTVPETPVLEPVVPTAEPAVATAPPTVPTAPATEPTAPPAQADPPASEPAEPAANTEPTYPFIPNEPGGSIPTALRIDTENVYQGMDLAYEDGYMPRTENGYMYLVLPLLSNGSIYENKIKVSLGLGGGASSPFVIANYEKTFYLETVVPKNSMEEIELFLVKFELTLSDDRVNGVYPVTVSISGYDETGKSIDCTHTIYVTIFDGKSNKVSAPAQSVPTAEPVVYISSSTVQPEKVMAGQEFSLTVTLKNSLNTKMVKNMMVKVDTGNLQINLLEDTNIFQIDKIPAGEEAALTLRFGSDASIPAGKYNLNFTFSYDSSTTLKLSSAGSTIVEIQQPANMELVMPRFPQSVTVGETIPVSLQVMNMGRDRMNNVRCVVSGFGFAPSNTGYIGTMDAGSSSMTKVELYIIALNASKGNDNGSQYGTTTGTVTLIYEDSSGEEFSQETQFETEVKRPIVELPQTQDREDAKQQASRAWWVAILVLGGVALGTLIIAFVVGHNKRKDGPYL